MKYKNIKTGAVITSETVFRGKNWVELTDDVTAPVEQAPVSEQVIEEAPQETAPVEQAPVSDDSYASITAREIKQELDAMGIAYKSNATKRELYDLMIKGE